MKKTFELSRTFRRFPAIDKLPTAGRKARRLPEIPIWDRIAALGAQIPEEEAARFPTDGAENVDHYLYGAPKKK